MKEWEKHYRSLLDTTLDSLPGVQFVIGAPFTAASGWACTREDFSEREAMIARLDTITARIAADYHATYLPYDKMFHRLQSIPDLPADYWIWDGIHPTPAGHRRMADLWLNSVTLPPRNPDNTNFDTAAKSAHCFLPPYAVRIPLIADYNRKIHQFMRVFPIIIGKTRYMIFLNRIYKLITYRQSICDQYIRLFKDIYSIKIVTKPKEATQSHSVPDSYEIFDGHRVLGQRRIRYGITSKFLLSHSPQSTSAKFFLKYFINISRTFEIHVSLSFT